MNGLSMDEATARTIALHWESLSHSIIQGDDDHELIREIGRFLASISADSSKAEQSVLRKKNLRDRTDARKKQLTMFPDDPEQAG